MKLINQGRFARNVRPPCGTTGLGTCVGLFVPKFSGWFIAHIDCSISEPRKQHDGAWNLIVESVVRQLEEKCPGRPLGESVAVSGGWGTKSTDAILAGITNWADGNVKKINSWEYLIRAGGGRSVRFAGANNFIGNGPFTVPD